MEETFLEIDNFILSYKRLQTYMGDYYKQLYREDLNNFGLNLEQNIKTLISSISKEMYYPSNSSKIYIPKSNGTVRPISVISFTDLLVYQAIINKLADAFYPDFKYKFNRYVFGNIYQKSEKKSDKIFFYIPWKKQWRKYNFEAVKCFKDGYRYKCGFDLASFYDTIDHSILIQFIKRKIHDEKLIDILSKQLNTWSYDNDRTDIHRNHGIPQGVKASGFLAEIMLDYIDEKMINLVSKYPTIKYLRYVDDINIFVKDKKQGFKVLAYLDLLSRDLGLIPQTSKIGIILIKNESEIYDNNNKNISRISNQYRKNYNQLNTSNNNKLLRKLKENLIDSKIEDKTYDKTIIKFSLHRIEADEELKNTLLHNINLIYDCFDEMCFYLSKHFSHDTEVKETFTNILIENKVNYNYMIAIIFKYFYRLIDYDKKLLSVFVNIVVVFSFLHNISLRSRFAFNLVY